MIENPIDIQLPDIRLMNKIGEGGMSVVWKAMDLKRNKVVAVKILNRDMTENAGDLAQFMAEQKVMETIDHPGIVKSYEMRNTDGVWYYEMEYVDGYSFGALLTRKLHLKQVDCLLICESVASALDHAWNMYGVVHRDINPDNIMINTDGVVKLTDLGLCHTFQYLKNGRQKVPSHVMGTPAYISPEQVYGDLEPDCRTDIYSLGATLYHLATGRVLFTGMGSEEMMRAHCDPRKQGCDPRYYWPDLTEGFCQMLEFMLIKNRDYRIPTWADVFATCRQVERGVAFKPRKSPGVSSMHLGM